MNNANSTPRKDNRTLKMGSYSTLVIVIAIVVAIVANLLVGRIPSSYTKLDLTENKLYSISDQTQEIVSSISDEVTVYLIAETGSEASTITELLDKYKPLSGHLTIEYKDPILYPTFTSQFTSDSVTSNSVIVTSAKRTKVIPYSSMVISAGSYVNGEYQSTSSFDGENQITSAIDYVTSDNLPVIYQLTGHGETGLSSTLSNQVANENISLETLALTSVEAVPEDAACLLITAPLSDYTQDDIVKLSAYMESGGNIVCVTNIIEGELPNLYDFLSGYGLSLVDGVVVEGDARHIAYTTSGTAYPHYLLPDLQSHEITAPLIDGGYMVLYPIAQGLDIATNLRSTLTVTELLTSSDAAYAKTDIANMTTFDKEAGDVDGPFALAAAVEDSRDGSKLVWYTTYYLLDENVDLNVSGGNSDLFLNTLGWLCQRESSVTIRSKTLSIQSLNINTADGRSLNIFFIGILPLAALICGGVVWYRRKKR